MSSRRRLRELLRRHLALVICFYVPLEPEEPTEEEAERLAAFERLPYETLRLLAEACGYRQQRSEEEAVRAVVGPTGRFSDLREEQLGEVVRVMWGR